MGALLYVEAVGFRDGEGRFARRSQAMARARREAVRESAQQMLVWLRFYAPHRTGVFEQGINYRTDDRTDGTTTATMYVKGPHAYLLPFIVKGTRPHLIPRGGRLEQMAKGYPLHWIDDKTGKHIRAWEVHHPGTKPNPFITQAQEAASPFVRAVIQEAARKAAFSEGV